MRWLGCAVANGSVTAQLSWVVESRDTLEGIHGNENLTDVRLWGSQSMHIKTRRRGFLQNIVSYVNHVTLVARLNLDHEGLLVQVLKFSQVVGLARLH